MSVFNRDMSIEVLRNGLGILKIPEGITELSGDFALVFDWIPGKKYKWSFREIQLPSSIQKINGIYLTEYGPDEAPIKRFKRMMLSHVVLNLIISVYRMVSNVFTLGHFNTVQV